MHEPDGEGEPAHHARRPMNAFLIFCKRHRSVVREKYPNLENRSITKILGEWWANLEKDEKACYTGLAKQYKDAFFSANPDFKWYKLPAPPLRTLTARPRDPNENSLSAVRNISQTSDTDYHDSDVEKTNNNSTRVDFNKRSNDHSYELKLSMFTPGKLADEAQMGSLSSLLAVSNESPSPNPYYSPPPFNFDAISTPERSYNILERSKSKCQSKEDSIRELQNALSETTKIFKEDFEDRSSRMYRYNNSHDQFTNQDVIDQIVDKRYSSDEYYHRNYSDDEKNMKYGRSCKGKRYQEFMAVGGLIVNKRQKRDEKTPDENYTASCSWDPGSSRSEESTATDDSKHSIHNENSNDNETKLDTTDAADMDNNASKAYKAADFDLDAKIKALPSLSLEKFQQKKRENKRRKRTVNLKPKSLQPSYIINTVPRSVYKDEIREMAENWRETMTGSQKRKPRKVSITRLEINSLVPHEEAKATHGISPQIKIATEAPCTVVQDMEFCKQLPAHGCVDLLALATLAEVAANTSKIEDLSAINNMSAKTSDDNASKV